MSSMSRMHFQAIADTLKDSAKPHMHPFDYARLVKEMGSTMMRFNGGFKRERFETACGAEEPPKMQHLAPPPYTEPVALDLQQG